MSAEMRPSMARAATQKHYTTAYRPQVCIPCSLLERKDIMKIIKASAVITGMLGAVAMTMAAPAFTGSVGEDVLDIHGWRIDNTEATQVTLDIHGWRIDTGDKTQQVAASNSPYIGTSMKVGAENLGFADPRPGQGDYQYSPDGELGFADPRPGE
jgi:hypothetical protein